MLIFPSAAIAYGITCIAILLFKPLALRAGLIDIPGGRKHHVGAIPLVGGIAMCVGVMAGLLVLPVSLQGFRSFFAGYALLVIVGILDDFHELTAHPRFAAQVIAAFMMTCFGGVGLHYLGNLLFLGDITLHHWAIPITVLAVVGMINAINMSDGLDGLAGSLLFIAFSLLSFLAYLAGLWLDASVLFVFICALLSFLCFNVCFPGRQHALVFMGDAGSMSLAFVLVWFLISLSQGPVIAAKPVTMLWITIVPLFDMVSVMLRRLIRRQSPFAPDREHVHHLLLALGLSPRQTVVALSIVALLGGVIGIESEVMGIAEGEMFVAFLILFAAYASAAHIFWQQKRMMNFIEEPE